MNNLGDMARMAACGIQEALTSLREKPIRSTMLERLQLIDEADRIVQGLPQPRQLGRGLTLIAQKATLPLKQHDLLLGRIPEKLPNPEQEAWLLDFESRHGLRPAWLVDTGHITLSWDMLLESGISGLAEQARLAFEQRQLAGDDPATLDFLEGIHEVFQAYRLFISRYGQAAADRGMQLHAEICDRLTRQPPATFREALQLMLLVGQFYTLYAAVNSTLTYGRMDQLLGPYFQRELAAGTLDEEAAGALIDDFNCKNNLILGRGEHQMSGQDQTDTGWFRNPAYDTPQYVILGGYTAEGDRLPDRLTRLFLRHITPRFENPVYVFRRTCTDTDSIWEQVCDKLRQNASLLVYNDETEIPAFIRSGFKPEDAREYTIHGCNWPDIPGRYAVIGTMSSEMPQLIMHSLFHENGEPKSDYPSMDDIYQSIASHYEKAWQPLLQSGLQKVSQFGQRPPERLSCTDCLTRGTIDHACGIDQGAVPYPTIYNLVRYIGSAADMLSAIDQVIYRDRRASWQELAAALRDNFQGWSPLLAACRRAGRYGRDGSLAQKHAQRLMQLLLDLSDRLTAGKDKEHSLYLMHVTITDMNHIPAGAALGATPDGRLAGEPLSENLSPSAVTVTGSVTSLLNTVAGLPLDRIHSGALNLRLQRDLVSGKEGLQRLKILLRTYFDQGGMQVQLSIADTEELLAAQKNPGSYRDLMVRITGYSAAFVDMSKKAQDEMIRREALLSVKTG